MRICLSDGRFNDTDDDYNNNNNNSNNKGLTVANVSKLSERNIVIDYKTCQRCLCRN